jgi:hypothetical protein
MEISVVRQQPVAGSTNLGSMAPNSRLAGIIPSHAVPRVRAAGLQVAPALFPSVAGADNLLADESVQAACGPTVERMRVVIRNPDHATVAVADGAAAIRFFGLLGFRETT